ANDGTETANFIDMGINSSGYSPTGVLGGAHNAYLQATGNDFVIGNASNNKNLILFTTATGTSTERMRIQPGGNVGVGTSGPNSLLEVGGSFGAPITTTSTNITLDATNYTVIITGGTPTVTLPGASSSNAHRIYIIVNETGSAVTISTYKDFTG